MLFRSEEDRLSKDTEVRELKEIQDSGEFGDTVGIPNKIKIVVKNRNIIKILIEMAVK